MNPCARHRLLRGEAGHEIPGPAARLDGGFIGHGSTPFGYREGTGTSWLFFVEIQWLRYPQVTDFTTEIQNKIRMNPFHALVKLTAKCAKRRLPAKVRTQEIVSCVQN